MHAAVCLTPPVYRPIPTYKQHRGLHRGTVHGPTRGRRLTAARPVFPTPQPGAGVGEMGAGARGRAATLSP